MIRRRSPRRRSARHPPRRSARPVPNDDEDAGTTAVCVVTAPKRIVCTNAGDTSPRTRRGGSGRPVGYAIGGEGGGRSGLEQGDRGTFGSRSRTRRRAGRGGRTGRGPVRGGNGEGGGRARRRDPRNGRSARRRMLSSGTAIRRRTGSRSSRATASGTCGRNGSAGRWRRTSSRRGEEDTGVMCEEVSFVLVGRCSGILVWSRGAFREE